MTKTPTACGYWIERDNSPPVTLPRLKCLEPIEPVSVPVRTPTAGDLNRMAKEAEGKIGYPIPAAVAQMRRDRIAKGNETKRRMGIGRIKVSLPKSALVRVQAFSKGHKTRKGSQSRPPADSVS